ncbi:hypothetical protein, partial [Mycobacterium tuberculosis]
SGRAAVPAYRSPTSIPTCRSPTSGSIGRPAWRRGPGAAGAGSCRLTTRPYAKPPTLGGDVRNS